MRFFAKYREAAGAMAGQSITIDHMIQLVMANEGYTKEKMEHAATVPVAKAKIERRLGDIVDSIRNGKGQELDSCRETIWGVLQGITHYYDHMSPAREEENRQVSSWFGPNSHKKASAFDRCLELIN